MRPDGATANLRAFPVFFAISAAAWRWCGAPERIRSASIDRLACEIA
jgi:hypothetical protein